MMNSFVSQEHKKEKIHINLPFFQSAHCDGIHVSNYVKHVLVSYHCGVTTADELSDLMKDAFAVDALV